MQCTLHIFPYTCMPPDASFRTGFFSHITLLPFRPYQPCVGSSRLDNGDLSHDMVQEAGHYEHSLQFDRPIPCQNLAQKPSALSVPRQRKSLLEVPSLQDVNSPYLEPDSFHSSRLDSRLLRFPISVQNRHSHR